MELCFPHSLLFIIITIGGGIHVSSGRHGPDGDFVAFKVESTVRPGVEAKVRRLRHYSDPSLYVAQGRREPWQRRCRGCRADEVARALLHSAHRDSGPAVLRVPRKNQTTAGRSSQFQHARSQRGSQHYGTPHGCRVMCSTSWPCVLDADWWLQSDVIRCFPSW